MGHGSLLRKNKLVVGQDNVLRGDLLAHFHGGSIGGHSGVEVTTHKICSMLLLERIKEGG